MGDITCLYYTSNKEDRDFEQKIIDNINNNCPYPIVSVSQVPMELGKNICVGDVGRSYINEYRQILLGLREIKTEYFISTESDFLHPPDYFKFEPKGENIYRSDNVWVIFDKDYAYKKPYSEGAQIAKTDMMIEFIEYYLEGLPEWFDGRPKHKHPFYVTYKDHQKSLWELPFTFFHTDPIITFKTDNGVNKTTQINKTTAFDLPHWGNIKELREYYV